MVMSRQAPVLDRPATLGVAEAGGRNQHGEYEIGAVTEHSIWFMLRDWEAGADVGMEGTRQTGDVEIITRYRRDVLVEALSNRAFPGWYLEIEGLRFQVIDAAELSQYGRRRFMKIIGARST